MKKLFYLEDYHISPDTGFLLDKAQRTLPPYFEPWERIAKSLVKLYKNKTMRDEIHKLELLDHTKLKGRKELFLAHMELAFMSSAYVWQDGDAGVPKILPKCLAVPLYEVSKQLGVKPIVSHIDVCLSNWYLADPKGNLKCVLDIPGGKQGNHFCLVTALVELQFAKCLKPMVSALNIMLKAEENEALKKQMDEVLLVHLESLCRFIGDMKDALRKMHDGLEADVFFNEIRPILAGWQGKGSPLSDGLIYEGISEDPIKVTGGSAAQSSTFQALDAFLGIIHTKDENKFLTEMRPFMPPEHAKFIEDLLQCPVQLVSYVKSTATQGVKDVYNKCLSGLVELRGVHLGIATKYVVKASRECNRQKYESLNEAGTGGTDVMPFLTKIRSNTRKSILCPRSYAQPLPGLPFYVVTFVACLVPLIIAAYNLQ